MPNQKGVTYIYALMMIIVIETGIIGISTFWQSISKRDNEEELLFRGSQIRRGIGMYYNKYRMYPSSLEELLKDSRTPRGERYLRKPYKDPFNKNGEWEIIRDPAGRIAGVASKSNKKPYKMANFPAELKSFEEKEKYSDWKFLYVPAPVPVVQPPPVVIK